MSEAIKKDLNHLPGNRTLLRLRQELSLLNQNFRQELLKTDQQKIKRKKIRKNLKLKRKEEKE